MGDVYPVVKVAAVQAASVFLDREGSTEKACRLIREAGQHGARVIAFPEGFIPAHPVWYHHHPATGALANRLSVELFKNSVEIPGREVDALAAAAREAGAYVVIFSIPLARKQFMLDPSNIALTVTALGIGVLGAAIVEAWWWLGGAAGGEPARLWRQSEV